MENPEIKFSINPGGYMAGNIKSICVKTTKHLKTKADMLERIKELERLQVYYHDLHEKRIAKMELDQANKLSSVYSQIAQQLLEAHINGMKEGSFPRRH